MPTWRSCRPWLGSVVVCRDRACGGRHDRSEVFEEREQPVGRLVAAGAAGGRRRSIQGALFELEVGVEVDVGRAFLLVPEPKRDR